MKVGAWGVVYSTKQEPRLQVPPPHPQGEAWYSLFVPRNEAIATHAIASFPGHSQPGNEAICKTAFATIHWSWCQRLECDINYKHDIQLCCTVKYMKLQSVYKNIYRIFMLLMFPIYVVDNLELSNSCSALGEHLTRAWQLCQSLDWYKYHLSGHQQLVLDQMALVKTCFRFLLTKTAH